MPAVAKENDRAQRRQARGFELAGLGMAEFRRQLAQHANVIGGLETLGANERLAADFVESVFELGGAVGGIGFDQEEPWFSAGALSSPPLRASARPTPGTMAGFRTML